MNWGERGLIRLIEAYQRKGGGRAWFGAQCNFIPSCSEYTRQAILRFGGRRGLYLGWQRFRRCRHPEWIHPRPDPLPSQLLQESRAPAPPSSSE